MSTQAHEDSLATQSSFLLQTSNTALAAATGVGIVPQSLQGM